MLKESSFSVICPRQRAISLLLANDPNILRLIFSSDGSSLNASAKELIEMTCAYSSGQRLLAQIALDIWSNEGGALLWEIVCMLDPVRFEGFMLALECLRYGNHQK